MIDRLWPDPAKDLSDDDLVPLPGGKWLRVNFIESVDGAATVDGRSGGLGTDADHRIFELLRRTTDAVLIGAGTVRAEGYGALRVSDESAAWRVARGMPAHPVFVIVTGALDLDPASEIFSKAPVRPVIVTSEGHDTSAFDGLADVIETGLTVDIPEMLAELRARGLARILNEGGPSLFTSLLEAAVVDELRLTVSPVVVGGDGKHITTGSFAQPIEARVAEILYGDGTLLYSYRFGRLS